MIKKYFKSEFVKNIVILISSSGISQLIPFLILPILQKYFYSPQDFGELTLYVTLSLMLVKFSTFSYELAIVKQQSEKNALSIFKGSVIILFITTTLIALVLVSMTLFYSHNFYVKNLHSSLFLIPFSVFSFGFYQILRYWFNWKSEFKVIGGSMITKSISAETTKLLLGYLKSGSMGLVVGRLLGELFSFLHLFYFFLKEDYQKLKKIQLLDIKELLKSNYQFPLYSMPSGLKGTLISLIFISLFTKYFGLSNAGIIGVSVSYIAAGFGIVSQSFSQVFYKRIYELKGLELFNMLKKNVFLLAFISASIVLVIHSIPNSFIANLLGPQWIDFMPVLKILIFAISISFITSSVSFIYIRMNRQKEMLFFDVFHLALVTSSIILGNYFTQDFMQTLIWYVIAQIIYYIFALFLAFYFVKKSY